MIKDETNYLGIFLLAFAIVLVGISTEDVFASENVTYVNELSEGLQEPIDTAIGIDGKVYVLDKLLAKVFVYSDQGQLLFTFSEQGSLTGQLNQPTAISVAYGGNVVVADTGNNRIQIFSPEGYFIALIDQYGDKQEEFNDPANARQ